jgi:hypothetical protein
MDKSKISATVTSTNNPAKSNDNVTVTITYTLPSSAKFVPHLISVASMLTGSASMRYE